MYYYKLTGKTFIISTSTIALQEQLGNDVKKLSELMHFPINVTIAKGKTNYLCKNKLLSVKTENIKKELEKDIEAFYEGDPASTSKEEIIITYPGFLAIMIYRIAHVLYKIKMAIVPRMMTEIAHSKTGIDIHPGATIGSYFFIDHGTGVVIGETCEIGCHVRIYQGVTLGALSLENARSLAGKKRHPTIKNNVIIYAGASILGGDTVIGNNVTIGSNVFITSSIDDNCIVKLDNKNYKITNK